MLNIKVGGEFLDLVPGMVIQLVINNPMFEDDVIQGDYTMPVMIPLSARNRGIFGHLERLDGVVASNKFDCEVYEKDIKVFEGVLCLEKPGNGGYDSYILVNLGAFSSLIQGKKLSDLTLGGPITLPGGPPSVGSDQIMRNYANTITAQTYPTSKFNFFEVFMENLVKVNYSHDVVNDLYGASYLPMIPFLFVNFILDGLFRENKITKVSGSWFADAEINSLTILNNYITDFRTGGFLVENDTIDPKNHVPDMLLTDFLNALRNTFGLGIIIKGDNVEVVPLRDILHDNSFVDWTEKVDKDYYYETDHVGFTMDFEFDGADDFKSISDGIANRGSVNAISDLTSISGPHNNDIAYVRSIDLYYVYNSTFSVWEYHKSNVSSRNDLPVGFNMLPSVADRASLPTPVDIIDVIYIEKLNQFWKTNTDGSVFWWSFYSDNFFPVITGNGVKIIKPNTSPVGMALFFKTPPDTPNNAWYLMPKVFWKTSNDVDVKGVNPFGLRFCFYRGIRSPSSGSFYGLGSSDVWDYYGNKVGNYSLAWDGANGLYETWWKEWLSFVTGSKKVTRNVRLNIADVLNLDLKRKVLIGNVKYFIKSVTVSFPLENVAVVELQSV